MAVVKVATAELFILRIVVLAIHPDPNTSSPQAGLEALDAHNGKQEPEEAYEKCNVHEQWRGLL